MPKASLLFSAIVLLLIGFGPPARSADWPTPVPVVAHVATADPVVFITLDDGWNHDAAAQKLLLDRHIPASLFLLPGAYSYDAGYFHALVDRGPSRVENHTIDHPDLTALDAAGQRAQLCGARERALAEFGQEPRLVRPPFGAYNDTTRTVAAACGAKALATWTYDFTTWGGATPPTPVLRPGDIVLLHFNDTVLADLTRALAAVDAAGLRPAPLRDYIPD
ncbi:polysaccharide deacetylase family protein [Nocardia arthritidis]|uniref:Polysaccharide deacetylase family protein n=1 Tax=Nocardia arthritidis TaxID=228602 RepID=A0A6G9YR63_9NOCA|nr:polysaccharide deacetylase family protein [Nocardia arthritidis]QIS15799.1 polysaccharide deacetylase family protein [Nocardia arthritidis]